ncbi:hypothetical protein HPP92_000792 [Vanilla planifolia]|uniref:Uncharacterized protein n=1 Tax=Vanilla planifolia TaxID=51239 RepID=A0A835RY57_VANPL|nr:hypothetical protein HPP92_000792 [Vanilla planifolia]
MVMVSIWFHGHQCCYRDTFMRLFNEGLLASGFTSAFAGNIKIVYLMHRRTAFSKTKNEQIVSSLRELEPHLNGLTARPKALQRYNLLLLDNICRPYLAIKQHIPL